MRIQYTAFETYLFQIPWLLSDYLSLLSYLELKQTQHQTQSMVDWREFGKYNTQIILHRHPVMFLRWALCRDHTLIQIQMGWYKHSQDNRPNPIRSSIDYHLHLNDTWSQVVCRDFGDTMQNNHRERDQHSLPPHSCRNFGLNRCNILYRRAQMELLDKHNNQIHLRHQQEMFLRLALCHQNQSLIQIQMGWNKWSQEVHPHPVRSSNVRYHVTNTRSRVACRDFEDTMHCNLRGWDQHSPPRHNCEICTSNLYNILFLRARMSLLW